MIEVIKQGNDVSITLMCECCGAIVRCLPGDLKTGSMEVYNVPPECTKKHGGPYGPCEIRYYQYIVCPNCHLEIKKL